MIKIFLNKRNGLNNVNGNNIYLKCCARVWVSRRRRRQCRPPNPQRQREACPTFIPVPVVQPAQNYHAVQIERLLQSFFHLARFSVGTSLFTHETDRRTDRM